MDCMYVRVVRGLEGIYIDWRFAGNFIIQLLIQSI